MYRAPRYLETERLDIFLSHVHLDHVIGLTFLHSVRDSSRLRDVTVHAPAEKLAALREHLFAELLFPTDPPYDAQLLRDEEPLPNGGRLTHFPLEHNGGSLGYRLDWPGHSMAYVTDVTADVDAAYVEKIRGVDLLIHECYFGDDMADWARKTYHSHTTPVAEVARAAGVGRLVLVHLNPASDRRRSDRPAHRPRRSSPRPCSGRIAWSWSSDG